jgi:hypothetical protein
MWKPPCARAVLPIMTTDPARGYQPPDPTQIEDKPEALSFWARTLETDADRIRRAVRKVGPILETVKKELGIGGVG